MEKKTLSVKIIFVFLIKISNLKFEFYESDIRIQPFCMYVCISKLNTQVKRIGAIYMDKNCVSNGTSFFQLNRNDLSKFERVTCYWN